MIPFGADRVISRGFENAWPPHSPDLNPCDFYLWGHLKEMAYRERHASVAVLKSSITRHGSSESVQEFATRINKLGTQIFQSGNSAQNTAVSNANDQLLQSRFISGLRNDIRRFVLSHDPLNLDESISAALIEEQNMKLNQIVNDERSGLSPSQTENSVLSALTDRLEEINLRVLRLQEASSVTARKTGGNFLTEGRMFSNVFIVAFKDIDKRSEERRSEIYAQPITSPSPEKRN
ncbi:hypothetical protein TNCV_4235811 [Trichonephila clavipes]|nr:hypothetical protein TNCV_4235811 [Trichonephila clavipes]